MDKERYKNPHFIISEGMWTYPACHISIKNIRAAIKWARSEFPEWKHLIVKDYLTGEVLHEEVH